MICSFRGVKFDAGDIGPVISSEPRFNDAQEQYGLERVWILNGFLRNRGGNLATMRTLITNLIGLFADPLGGDLLLYHPDGVTIGPHYLLSDSCLGGTRVTRPPAFPSYQGPEGVTYRTWTAEVRGFIATPTDSGLVSFTETLNFEGVGAPSVGFHHPLTAIPHKQLLKRATTYVASQEGRIVGQYSYPTARIPRPKWPNDLVDGYPKIVPGSAEKIGADGLMNYPISYAYRFESNRKMSGTPTQWTDL